MNIFKQLKGLLEYRFILYSNNIVLTRTNFRLGNGLYILREPIEFKAYADYRACFFCTLTEAMKDWGCVKQILLFQRFSYSFGVKGDIKMCTKFVLWMLPIVYIFAVIDTGRFNSISIVKFSNNDKKKKR